MITVPTLLTIARMISSPFIGYLCAVRAWWGALALFMCAALTDFADGFLARRWGQESFLGACLDPIADKLLMFALVIGMRVGWPEGLPGWLLPLLMVREMMIVLGAGYFVFLQHSVPVQPIFLAKLSTALQLIVVCGLLGARACGFLVPSMVLGSLWCTVGLVMVASLCRYVYMGWQLL